MIYVYLKARTITNSVNNSISDFFKAKGEDGVSDYMRLTSNLCELFAEEASKKALAAIQGSIGGSMKGVNAELRQTALEDNPELAFYEMLPKSIKKSPVLSYGAQVLANRFIEAINKPKESKYAESNGKGITNFKL